MLTIHHREAVRLGEMSLQDRLGLGTHAVGAIRKDTVHVGGAVSVLIILKCVPLTSMSLT